MGDGPDLGFAKGAVNGWYKAREKRLARRAMRAWRDFKRLKPFWI
jgi:hypothetical protein